MSRLGVSLAMLLVACGAGPTVVSGSPEPQAIVGGSPSMAFLSVGSLLSDGVFSCTATVVAPTRILTAAHCLWHGPDRQPKLTFAIGPSPASPYDTVDVVHVSISPGYDPQLMVSPNDIGVAWLARPFEHVTPLPLLSDSSVLTDGLGLLFVGYGSTNQAGANLKHSVAMPIREVDATTFRYGDDETNTCDGDSGGPAIYTESGHALDDGHSFLAGTTWKGDSNCTSYGVDVRVDAFSDFLQAALSDSCESDGSCGACEVDPDCVTAVDGLCASATWQEDHDCQKTCGADDYCTIGFCLQPDPDCAAPIVEKKPTVVERKPDPVAPTTTQVTSSSCAAGADVVWLVGLFALRRRALR